MPITDDALTTVFCAVWSGDADRWALLETHQACLQAQTVDVSVVNVFDAGDQPPDWVRGRRVVAEGPLTIYQAWNVATQVATTALVMNLNLDDRLAPGAVEALQAPFADDLVGLVGGDWRICHSQEATDQVAPVHDAHDLPFDPAWPPAPGSVTRLGSGTGDRGTFGPATIWRRSLHDRVPYPSALASGEPIRIVGDLAWWTLVTQHLRARAVRLPLIVGNYHSHPSSQAEFRHADEHEALGAHGVAMRDHGLSGIRFA